MSSQRYRLKRMLGLCCTWSGLTLLRWRLLPPGLYVLNYHRVGNPNSTSFDRGSFSCDVARFRLHLELIRERFEVVNLARLAHVITSGKLPRGKPLAMITFDDGYADNYSVAFPLLKEFGLSAAFFLPTAFIGTNHIPWWDEIAWHITHSPRSVLTIPGEANTWNLAVSNRDKVVRAVLQWARRRTEPMSEKVAMVREAADSGDVPCAERGQLFMSWSQAREMLCAGMDIGSHTESHNILSHLTEKAQFRELVNSRRILEDELGAPVDSIAYPVGDATCYTPRTLELSQSAGYQIGFNFLGRAQRLPVANPLNVNRIGMDDHAYPHSTLRGLITFPTLAFN